MLDLSKVQHLAETYAPQELFAALVWQRQFNLFDGPQVIKDGLWGRQSDQDRDAIVVSYWWD